MKKSLIFISSVSVLIAGCSVPTIDSKTLEAEKQKSEEARAKMARSIVRPAESNVVESGRVMIPVVPSKAQVADASSWIASKRVMLSVNGQLPLSDVFKIFWSQGINVSSTIPLDGYVYSGQGLNDTDAETGLKLVLSSVGLDYEIDNVRKVVYIKPMESRTWYLNLGNRTSTYSSGGGQGGQQQGGAGIVGQQGAANQNAQTVSAGVGSNGAGNSGNTSITSSDNFWQTLQAELKSRLTVLVPTPQQNRVTAGVTTMPQGMPPVPTPLNAPLPANMQATNSVPQTAAPQAIGNTGSNSGSFFTSRQLGSFSTNAETGAITVQAPHWILESLDLYLKRIQEMYNTDITFSGELVMLTTDANASEGLDISSFGRYASSNFGLAYSNNSLGGVTISVPDAVGGTPSISASKALISPTMLGVKNLMTGFQIFNAYLSNHGSVKVVQKPVISTTSGVPVVFSKIVTEYFNSASQQATSANVGGAATATNNTLVPVDLGTVITINPRFDINTGLIRAQITLYQTLKSGSQTINQPLSAGNSLQQQAVQIPIVTKLNYSGEALLKDGDMIIVGGQTDDTSSDDSNGITGLKDTFVGGLFGNKGATKRTSTYYFAMRVTTHKRDVPMDRPRFN